MPVIVATSSPDAAQEAAQRLRRDGFLARSACRGGSSVVIVECLSGDWDAVPSRVERCDAASRT